MGKKFYRFKTECWAPLKFKSYLWYPDISVWVLGVGLCMGSQKFTNEYLGIHTDGLKCLNLW